MAHANGCGIEALCRAAVVVVVVPCHSKRKGHKREIHFAEISEGFDALKLESEVGITLRKHAVEATPI